MWAAPFSGSQAHNDAAALQWSEALAADGFAPASAGAPGDGDGGGGKPCHPRCAERGNCNREEGRCECPFGFAGAACEVALLPACALAPNATAVHCGDGFPRPCACLRQCAALFCPEDAAPGAGCSLRRDEWAPRCFERVEAAGSSGGGSAGVDSSGGNSGISGSAFSSAGVYSAIPEEDEEAAGRVLWFQGIRADQRRRRLTRREALRVRGPQAFGVWGFGDERNTSCSS